MLEREQLVGNGGDLSVFLQGGLLAVPPRLISFGKSDKYVCVCSRLGLNSQRSRSTLRCKQNGGHVGTGSSLNSAGGSAVRTHAPTAVRVEYHKNVRRSKSPALICPQTLSGTNLSD